MRITIATLFLFVITITSLSSANATVVTTCYPWTTPSPLGANYTVNDCVLYISDEPQVPNVDRIAISMWVDSHIYVNGSYITYDTADNGDEWAYPDAFLDGFPFVDEFTFVHSLAKQGVYDVKHDPYCYDVEWQYRQSGVWALYDVENDCNGYLGFSQIW